MNIAKFFVKGNILIIFLALAITVTFLQFFLLDLALKIGFKPDDWILYFTYKTLGQNPHLQLLNVWKERGIYTTYQVFYMGFLETFVGFNYHSFQLVSLLFKSFATLAIFPLIIIIFKSKTLAIISTLLFAFSAAATGPLEFVVKGSDYISIFWMCLFLIVYYLVATNHPRNVLWISVSLILLILTLIFSPIRLFPILILLPLIEIFLLIKNLSFENLKDILLKTSVIYLPLSILLLYAPDSISGLLGSPLGIFKKIIEGNWHLILSPFSGMGYTFITNDYWGKIFGALSVNSFEEYLHFLLGGPTVIFGLLILIVAFLYSKKPWLFFIATFILNFTLEILVFFIATHSKYLPNNQGMHYDQTGIYSALFGIYVMVLGVMCFIEWVRKDSDNTLLMAFWLGPLFLFIFTFATWAFAPFGTNFSSTSYYLVVASMGSSLLQSAFLLSIYNKAIQIRKKILKSIILILIFLTTTFILVMNATEIHNRFLYLLANGRSAQEQQVLQGRFREYTGGIDFTKPTLFYFDTSDLAEGGPFYSEGFLASFPFWMHFQDNRLREGCLEILYLNEHKHLLAFIKEQNGQKGFLYRCLCVANGRSGYKNIFYKIENFYAFKIKSRDFIDIKEQILKELGF